jgi:plastocyanin
VVVLLMSVSSGRAANTGIQVGSDWFCDASFQNGVCETPVTVGDSVTWQVVQGFHNVVQCDASYITCPPAGGFQSDFLDAEPGEPFGDTFSQTFSSIGTVAYWCSLHPDRMRGRIVVNAQPTAAPTAAPTATTQATQGTGSVVTASPAPVPGTAAPRAVPQTGGAPESNDSTPGTAALAGGVFLMALAGGLATLASRRR